MASIPIYGVCIAPVDDYEAELSFNAGVSVNAHQETTGEIRTYAGGRRRLIKRPGLTRTIEVHIPRTTRTQRETLAAWQAQLLLYRDGRGRLMFGTYLDFPQEDQPGPGRSDVGFTFQEITHSIEV